MIPLPVALLALLFTALATVSAARLYQALTGASQQSMLWAIGWLVVCGGAAMGLALLRSWGHRLAVLGLWACALATLSIAGLLAGARHPAEAMMTAIGAGLPVVGVQYLKRPAVRAWFH